MHTELHSTTRNVSDVKCKCASHQMPLAVAPLGSMHVRSILIYYYFFLFIRFSKAHRHLISIHPHKYHLLFPFEHVHERERLPAILLSQPKLCTFFYIRETESHWAIVDANFRKSIDFIHFHCAIQLAFLIFLQKKNELNILNFVYFLADVTKKILQNLVYLVFFLVCSHLFV